MGLTRMIEIEVGNPANPKITKKVEFLLDTGAIRSVVPKAILKDLGIKPETEKGFRLYDSSKVLRKKGIALFRFKKKTVKTQVIFGEPGDLTIIGAVTLQSFGLFLHPLSRELKPIKPQNKAKS